MAKDEHGNAIDVTKNVAWTAEPAGVIEVHEGVAVATSRGEATIVTSAANLSFSQPSTSRLDVMVLEPGTFKIFGRIQSDPAKQFNVAAYDVVGATVRVIEGTGTGLTTKSDSHGAYALYGVGGDIRIEVSASSYSTRQMTVSVPNSAQIDVVLGSCLPHCNDDPSARTVSGTVWKYTDQGREPVRTGHVFGWIEDGRVSQTTGAISIGSDGRYSFPFRENATLVRVNGTGLGAQPCAIALTPTPGVNLTSDLFIMAPNSQWKGVHLPDELLSQQPTLSGVVYEQTADGRRPLPKATVALDSSFGLGLQIAGARTDDEGRYLFCGVPELRGLDLWAMATGFQFFETSDVLGKRTFDIELRRR